MSDEAPSQVLAIVIGRAGSKGLPGKNALHVAGRPMVCHTIDHAIQSSSVDQVIVSTDGQAITEAARSMSVPVVLRPAELADDHATVDAAVRHAVETYERETGSHWNTVVVLYANVPVRPAGLIDEAVRLLKESGADSVQSYCDVGKWHPYWMVMLDDQHRVQQHHPNAVYRRQDLPKLLLPDGGVIAVTRASLFCGDAVNAAHPHAFLGNDRRGFEVPSGAVVDVDSHIDLQVAHAMLTSAAARD